MSETLRILILEDNPADAELAQFELQEAGIDFTAKVVMDEKDFICELETSPPDLILSDYDLPRYDGALALDEAKRKCPDIPFILVTGAISENRAIEILTRGAKDYVLKSQIQQRLASAVQRAHREAEEHRARKRAEEELREAHRTLEERVRIRTAELEAEVKARTDMETALRRMTERLDMAQRAANVGTWDWDIVSGKIEWSTQMFDLFGLDPQRNAASVELWKNILYPGDFEIAGFRIEEALRERTILNSDYRIVMPDGQVRWINAIGEGKYDDQGRPIRMIGICTDITERKETEEVLRESEERFRNLLQHIPNVSIQGYGPDGATQYWNPASERLYGYAAQEAIGRNLMDLIIPPEMRGDVERDIQRMTETGQPIPASELSLMRKDGSRVSVHSSHAVIKVPGRAPELFCIDIDLTDRKQSEEAMQKALQRLQALVSGIKSSILFVGEEGIELANQAFCDYFDIPDTPADLTEVSPRKMIEKIKNAYLHPVEEILRIGEIIERGQPVRGEEIAMTGGRTCMRDFIPISVGGKLSGRLWHHTDITEQKQNYFALLESEERYRLLAETMLQGVVHQDSDGKIIAMNPAAERILGKSREQFLGSSSVHEDHDTIRETGEPFPGPEHPSMLALRSGLPIYGVIMGVFNPKLGEYRWVNIDAVPVFRPGEARPSEVYAVFEDITERKHKEMELKERTEQLEVANRELESFSYSVSHDLKAPLRAIDGYSRMLLKKDGDKLSEDTIRKLDVIRSNAVKMSVLIDDLLSFSKVLKSSISISEINMDKLAGEVWTEIMASNTEREIELKITNLLPGKGDPALIRQVLVNLLSNAVKFTKNKKSSIIEMSCYSENSDIVFCVRDNGVGFDMAYYDKLFGVFQRLHSQEEYEGMGVGLAIVHRIIDRHGGRVWAEGEVDKGAAFYFTLPLK